MNNTVASLLSPTGTTVSSQSDMSTVMVETGYQNIFGLDIPLEA